MDSLLKHLLDSPRDCASLALVNKTLKTAVYNNHRTRLAMLYERIEICLKAFLIYATSCPPFAVFWSFKCGQTQFDIVKQTKKNKCKHKSMIVLKELTYVSRHDSDTLYFVLDTHLQSIDEALDCFKNVVWPLLISNTHDDDVVFVSSCRYKRLSNRLCFDQLTTNMLRLMKELANDTQQDVVFYDF